MNNAVKVCSLLLIAVVLARGSWAEMPADAVWIDVRTPAEYSSGHLPQAVLIPFDGIEVGAAALGLEKDRPIYLYCSVGGRAEMARQALQTAGYSDVTNVGTLENALRLGGDVSATPPSLPADPPQP